MIVPGVVFDQNCGRIGHGKGYYDSFISRATNANITRGLPRLITIGICFDEQVLGDGERVPMAEHDEPLDYVVTPTRLFFRAL